MKRQNLSTSSLQVMEGIGNKSRIRKSWKKYSFFWRTLDSPLRISVG
jgi:hypothetical protein